MEMWYNTWEYKPILNIVNVFQRINHLLLTCMRKIIFQDNVNIK